MSYRSLVKPMLHNAIWLQICKTYGDAAPAPPPTRLFANGFTSSTA